MVYISKVYTRFGDEGDTMLASGDTVRKDSARVRAYGEVDELNATVGLLRLELSRDPNASASADSQRFAATLDTELARIQQELFNLGAELATPSAASGGARLKVEAHHIEAIEQAIDRHNDPLEPLRSFILPGGGPTGASAHLARTVCRRAERELVTLAADSPVRGEALRYLNRLSDYLFVVARAAAASFGYDEVLWDQQNT
ncbi:cob(I)yrinic acid a,c-diamide adenosyltransferase [Pseudenhygromyxa sp. WMMC2535]|uniref:cob(I)yrinic acid a,c-diamide adenosyltransferase n=1 Tax=Pseudenhygromyxa sp. WMMC2535 TaxID=2712867 RepID=UPI00155339E9|nr:cob(I)yrinic acid a,c-diamide adenosyltransferase [Pseudenhygromyxa sp. WMMC2535]NVB40972.1 cob(I)yrinic acid a,c-diamide adenosyltransferase [Pseudenhygromyxa sp. WMMC2535]